MIKKLDARSAVMAVFLAASVASDAAFAILEIEPNNTITTAQHLVIGSGGSVEVNGSLGAVHAHFDQLVAFQTAIDFREDRGRQSGSADQHDRIERVRPRFQLAPPAG